MKRNPDRATTYVKDTALVAAARGDGVLAAADVTACPFNKRAQRCIAPATPASWSRYIDSRLKQFCTR